MIRNDIGRALLDRGFGYHDIATYFKAFKNDLDFYEIRADDAVYKDPKWIKYLDSHNKKWKEYQKNHMWDWFFARTSSKELTFCRIGLSKDTLWDLYLQKYSEDYE